MQHDEVVPMTIDQIQVELNKIEAKLGPRLILLRLNAQLAELTHSLNPAKTTAWLTVQTWQRVLEHEPYNPRTQLSL
ncbi:MAG: hypothetical protein HC898_02405, partial [Phycisphaerales bacterium]|nr:hypothetical protein [Phycisphaerales bacterium]